MKCVLCNTGGSITPKELGLQSTTSGLVCPKCINNLVEDALVVYEE